MCGTEVRKLLVHGDAAALVGGEARRRSRLRAVGRGDAAGREQHHVGDDALARLEVQHRLARRLRRPPSTDSTASPKRKVTLRLAHLVDQLVDDLAVEELERPLAPLDQRHGDAERGEHRRVLDADHAGADHGERARQLLQPHDVVGVEDDLAVGLDAGRGRRVRADRDHDVRRGDLRASPPRSGSTSGVGIDERRLAAQHVDVVAAELVLDDLDLAGDHACRRRRRAAAQVGRASSARPRQPVALAGEARERDDGLAQRLARDGARCRCRRRRRTRRFSTTAARLPSLAACTAARCPAGPLPMQTRS